MIPDTRLPETGLAKTGLAEARRDGPGTPGPAARSEPASPRQAEFEALYRDDPDPWGMETSAYEGAKYDATLAALPRERFGRGLEVGCSIGVLSMRLAERCDRLLALDVSEGALARARGRPGAERVDWRRAEVPGGWPAGRYDLIVLSEVLYFLEPDEVRALAELAARDLSPGGALVLVNWLGACDRTLDGEGAARLFTDAARPGLRVAHGTRRPLYRIDVLERA